MERDADASLPCLGSSQHALQSHVSGRGLVALERDQPQTRTSSRAMRCRYRISISRKAHASSHLARRRMATGSSRSSSSRCSKCWWSAMGCAPSRWRRTSAAASWSTATSMAARARSRRRLPTSTTPSTAPTRWRSSSRGCACTTRPPRRERICGFTASICRTTSTATSFYRRPREPRATARRASRRPRPGPRGGNVRGHPPEARGATR